MAAHVENKNSGQDHLQRRRGDVRRKVRRMVCGGERLLSGHLSLLARRSPLLPSACCHRSPQDSSPMHYMEKSSFQAQLSPLAPRLPTVFSQVSKLAQLVDLFVFR